MAILQFERTVVEALPPQRSHLDDAGLDVSACILGESGRGLIWAIPPLQVTKIPTRLRLVAAPGHAILVLSRSGLATQSIFVANAPGLIDPGYRGELFILLYNGSTETRYIRHGDRIAQLLLIKLPSVEMVEAPIVADSERGEKGFGSTGQ